MRRILAAFCSRFLTFSFSIAIVILRKVVKAAI